MKITTLSLGWRARKLLFAIATLFVMVLQVSGNVYSQQIDLSLKNAKLETALRSISKQSGYRLLYGSRLLDNANPVTIQAKGLTLEQSLAKVFDKQPLQYSVEDKSIIIKRKHQSDAIVPSGTALKQQMDIRGQVTDSLGNPLSYVNIQEKGTKNGTSTDKSGQYFIKVSSRSAILIFSYTGYLPQEHGVSDENLNVKLKQELSQLDEVVVVGYGVQKKSAVTGSISTVGGKTLLERPTPNLQNLLQGRVAGLDIVQSTGEPGRDNANFRIRGLGSFGASSSPLVLVDGIIGSISNLNPQDIEEVTVLKDAASASIYGSRAANGVILVTTKKGKIGQDIFEYNMNIGMSQPTRYPKLVNNSATYMRLYNQALERSGRPKMYSDKQIDDYENATDRNLFPNFDWMDHGFNNAPVQSHQLGLSGGDEKTQYNISLGYLTQKGILKNYEYDRYNSLIDFSRKLKNWLKVGTNINFSYQDVAAPWMTNDGLLLLLYASAPTIKPFLPDGSGRLTRRDYTSTTGVNRTVDEVYAGGQQFNKKYNVNAQAFAEVKLTKGLNWLTKGAVTYYTEESKNRQYMVSTYTYHPDDKGEYRLVEASGNNRLSQSSPRIITKTLFSTLTYDHSWNNEHNFQALAGYEQQDNRNTNLSGTRFNFSSDDILELDGAPPLNQTTGGNASEWALQSFFGRVTYDYKGKYFLGGNIRHDGTSRVDPRYRWGTFGGGSAGWRISEESFIKDNVSWIDNLKLRASYGVLGNQEIGNYPYQDVLSNRVYPFENLNTGAIITAFTQRNLRWEKTAITDIGLDVDLFRGALGASASWYYKNTTDILAQRSDTPASLGLSAPTVNSGAMVNKGIEFELRHQHTIGEFNYGLSFLFNAYRNKVTQALAPRLGTFEVGQPYNNYFIYVWDGIFQSQQEIDNSPKQPNSGKLRPGDLKIKDVNGDGTVGPEDRVRFSRFPSSTYSFSLNGGWKGLNVSAFFQGVKGQNILVSGWGFDPFIQGARPSEKFLNAWTPENPSTTVPAVYVMGYAGVNGYSSTYSLLDASYLRLKNINISYSFPQTMLERIKCKGLTVFLSGDNLITWTKYEGNDPERAGDGRFAQFPQLRMYNAGLNVKF